VKEYADFNQEFLSWAQAALKSGVGAIVLN
jgi:hypothetical protein